MEPTNSQGWNNKRAVKAKLRSVDVAEVILIKANCPICGGLNRYYTLNLIDTSFKLPPFCSYCGERITG